jgi:hypothetical protein
MQETNIDLVAWRQDAIDCVAWRCKIKSEIGKEKVLADRFETKMFEEAHQTEIPITARLPCTYCNKLF